MSTQDSNDYTRIAEAIEYINSNYRNQPDLDEVAQNIHLSPFHFQRMFSNWVGVSPKKFLQFVTVEHAKKLLQQSSTSIAEATFETGLSGTGRLHDLFINIEGMTPGEYKNGGKELRINYDFADSPFGSVLIASTEKGICYMAFADDKQKAFDELKQLFPNAGYFEKKDELQADALSIFSADWNRPNKIKLHLKGTGFQLKVWNMLLKIPMGSLTSYGNLAQKIDNPAASRAVGSAVGDNPVAFLIPCHRVIQSTGVLGNYHWGSTRKTAMIGWESVKMYDKVWD
jgi:AraC family transcriptional regulator, regulatory protein of adaptative response / methylated-DNA-[protein]-cysteine methyltransferase